MKYANSLLLLFFFIIESTTVLFAQDFDEYKWHEYIPVEEIPDSLKSADAVMILNQRTIINDLDGISRWSVYQKIKIQTKQGIEDYAKIFVNKYSGDDIVILDARTIKESGEIVDLNKSDIKKLDFRSEYNDDDIEELRFMVPGVEVGDVIEVVYQVNEMTFAENVFFHSYLPILTSKLVIANDNQLITDIGTVNNLVEPKISKTSESVEYTWVIKNLPSIEYEYGAIKYEELPYVSLVLRGVQSSGVPGVQGTTRILQSNNWGQIYDQFLNAIENKMSPRAEAKRAFKDLMENVQGDDHYQSDLEKIYKLFSIIQDKLEMIPYDKEKTLTALENCIYDGQIDEVNLMYLYYKIFKELDVDFHIGFAKSRYKGVIDPEVASTHDLSAYFFAFHDEGGVLHYIYPSSDEKSYRFDELPPSIEGTKAVLVYKKKKDNLESSIEYVKLPVSTANDNRMNEQCQVKFLDSIVELNYRVSLTGAYSTIYREGYMRDEGLLSIDYFVDEDEIIDTSYVSEDSPFYPYDFTYVSELSAKNPLIKVNDTLWSVPIGFFLEDNTIDVFGKKRIMDYYPLFTRSESQKYYLQFESPVKLTNETDIVSEVSNKSGSAGVLVKQINPTTILLSSNYIINSSRIPREEVNTLVELNELIKETLDLDLVLIKQ